MRNDWRHLADQTTRPVLSHVEYSLYLVVRYLPSRSMARSCGLDIYVFQLHLMSVNFIIHRDRVSIHNILTGNKGAEYEKRGLLMGQLGPISPLASLALGFTLCVSRPLRFPILSVLTPRVGECKHSNL